MRVVKNIEMVQTANNLIPKDEGKKVLVTAYGDTRSIISAMQQTNKRIKSGTKEFAKKLKGPSAHNTLLNIWMFVKFNINYQVDDLGTQLIKTPEAIWWSRTCDCKGYSLFVSSILQNLGIKHYYRYAAYNHAPEVTHVYIIVPTVSGNRNYITIDGCMQNFNQEKTTTKTIDIKA